MVPWLVTQDGNELPLRLCSPLWQEIQVQLIARLWDGLVADDFCKDLHQGLWPLLNIVTDQVGPHSQPNTETPRLIAKKEFIHKAAKRGDRRISPQSATLKGLG